MSNEDLQAIIAGLRSIATSRLIIMMNADALVDVFAAIGGTTASERNSIIEAIAAEIDRRIPVPQ